MSLASKVFITCCFFSVVCKGTLSAKSDPTKSSYVQSLVLKTEVQPLKTEAVQRTLPWPLPTSTYKPNLNFNYGRGIAGIVIGGLITLAISSALTACAMKLCNCCSSTTGWWGPQEQRNETTPLVDK